MVEKQKKPIFRYKENEHPKNCPKCGKEATFEDNEESEDEYEIIRIRCDSCDFVWIEYFRYEKWAPLEEDEEDKDE